MKQYGHRLIKVFIASFMFCNVSILHAYTRGIRTVEQFDKVIAESPMSVVVFWHKSEGPKGLDRVVASVSREKKFKEANIKFWLIDLDRDQLSMLEERYAITQFPTAQIFLRTQPMKKAFLEGCFSQEELKRFIERYLGHAITTEINRKQARRQLAQSQRDYYVADYYNPFYMMPYFNYSPPSDWPDEGPLWVGIEVD